MGNTLRGVIAAALALLFTWGPAFAEGVIRASDGKEIGFSMMMKEVGGSGVIMVGEEHDSMLDHLRQIKILRSLNGSGIPIAIGLEMFTSRDQSLLDRWVAGNVEEEEFIVHFRNNWGVPWPYYRDIFLFARRHATESP
jgi:uncharacterized iron-regulated protein